MYCPKCATQIEDTQKFCRSCGANVSLVPQALTGQMLQSAPAEAKRAGDDHGPTDDKPVSIESAASSFFIGLSFVFVSFAARSFAPAGKIWWFWLLIPAFACMGGGIGQYLKLREQRRQQQPPQLDPVVSQSTPVSPTTRMPEISAPTTSELISPLSITEHTTKHLDQSRSN